MSYLFSKLKPMLGFGLSMLGFGGDEITEANSSSGNTGTGEIIKALNMDILEGVLHYLPHPDVQSCRLVSAEWNSFISHYDTSFKQRPQLDYLGVRIYDPETMEETDERNWQDITRFKNCCKEEIQPLADTLVGEMVDLDDDADVPYQMRLFSSGAVPIHLLFHNQLTDTSAFHYLHFLHHLNGSAIERVEMSTDYCLPMPTDFPLTIHCLELTLSCFSELKKAAILFPPRQMMCCVGFDEMEEALERITDAGCLPYPIVLTIMTAQQHQFREAFEFFHNRDVRSLVDRMELSLSDAQGGWNRWPLAPLNPRLPPKGFDMFNECEDGCEHYEYFYCNRQTRKPYVVVAHVERRVKLVRKVTLSFDRWDELMK